MTIGLIIVEPIVPRATSGWYLAVPLIIAGAGLGLLVSQLNNYTLAPISEERVSEAAGVNSAGGSFGLSFGLAFAGAILLAVLSVGFTSMAQSSTVLSGAEQQQVAKVLEHDAEVVSNTQLEKQLAGQPQKTQDEIIKINTQARHLALQVALLIPILAGLAGLLISFRRCARQTPSNRAPTNRWSWADPGPSGYRSTMSRVALVTGAGSGIGRAAAIRLSQAGLRVVLASRGADALAATAKACPGPTLAVPADVTDPAAVDRLFDRAEHDWGAVEVLIASAGAGFSARIERTSDADWKRMLELNLTRCSGACAAPCPPCANAGTAASR